MSTAEYQPKYVDGEDLDDIPYGNLAAEQDFGREKKLSILEDAESDLEVDVNDGATIENPTHIHTSAVKALASYLLYLPAANPSESRYGDVAEYGDSALDYVDRYLEMYERRVEKINAASPDETEGGDDTTGGGKSTVRSGIL